MKFPLIDILVLHHPNDSEKSAIRAFGSKALNEAFKELCDKFKERNNMNFEQISKEVFKVNKNSLHNWRGYNKNYPNGHPIPLHALSKIIYCLGLQNTDKHNEIIKKIQYLQCGRVSKKVLAPIYLTPELAKLCGAHAADGSLYGIKNRGPITAKWDIGDAERENIQEVRKWIKQLFDIDLPNIQKGQMSYTWTNMQIMARYLTRIFDFPIGKKTETVSEPSILFGNDRRLLSKLNDDIKWRLRLEFAKEVINFDGHSTKTGGIASIGLGCNSHNLRKSVREIFFHYGIEFKDYPNHIRILTTRKSEAKKILEIGTFRGNKRKKLIRLLGN